MIAATTFPLLTMKTSIAASTYHAEVILEDVNFLRLNRWPLQTLQLHHSSWDMTSMYTLALYNFGTITSINYSMLLTISKIRPVFSACFDTCRVSTYLFRVHSSKNESATWTWRRVGPPMNSAICIGLIIAIVLYFDFATLLILRLNSEILHKAVSYLDIWWRAWQGNL